MRRSTKKAALSFAIMVSIFPFFTNCSEPLKSFEANFSSILPSDTPLSVDGKTSAVTEKALLTSDQVLKSMSSVTGIEIDNEISGEYDRQQSVLAGTFNLDSVTPPMLIGITNLAARFCSKLVIREAAIANLDSRKQFKTINFTLQPANLLPADFTAAANSLALSFWGREATTAELANLEEARVSFLAGRDVAQVNSTRTNALMILICTGMLSSFESYTF